MSVQHIAAMVTMLIAASSLMPASARATETEPVSPGFLPPGDARAAGARHIVLIYNGRRHRLWEPDDFVPLFAYVNREGRPVAPMFDTLLVLPLALDSGHSFCPGFGEKPLDKAATVAYRDGRLFGGDDQLRSMDRAAARVAAALHAPAMRWKVILTLPYPSSRQTRFGDVTGDGHSLNFSRHEDRIAAMDWYIRTARQRWNAAGLRHLDLVGWYWVHEATDAADERLLPEVARLVHADGGRLFWIPWFKAPGSARWASSGFDAAIHQPNYFFRNYKGTDDRLYEAAEWARKHGMGVEMELDEDVLTRAESRARYRDYLRVGAETGYRDHALTAWYMGVAALLRCAQSEDPEIRAIYDETHRFIAGRDG